MVREAREVGNGGRGGEAGGVIVGAVEGMFEWDGGGCIGDGEDGGESVVSGRGSGRVSGSNSS